ncbi:MAG TPA: hypothetical protein VMU54_24865 [Planctomycetota bacterium]|nr:hypothetical protein [Planctomycetota bacterium]
MTTAARVLEALRRDLARQRRRLVSVRNQQGGPPVIQDHASVADPEKDPLLAYVIPPGRLHSPRGKEEDKDDDMDR